MSDAKRAYRLHGTLTLDRLIEELEYQRDTMGVPGDTPVVLSTNYRDYTNTEQTHVLHGVEVAPLVARPGYSDTGWAVGIPAIEPTFTDADDEIEVDPDETREEAEPGAPEVVVLNGYGAR